MRHVEDVSDLVQCEVVGVLCCKLVADEDVGVDLVHPALLPVDVGLHFAPHQLVALLGGVGLRISICTSINWKFLINSCITPIWKGVSRHLKASRL